MSDSASLPSPHAGSARARDAESASNSKMGPKVDPKVPSTVDNDKSPPYIHAEGTPLDDLLIDDVLYYLPHRAPMLFVDKIVDIRACKSATGLKFVTYNEWFFNGHFREQPIFPGVFMLEGMAQTAACLLAQSMGIRGSDRIIYFLSADDVRFRVPVRPGSLLEFRVTILQRRRNIWKFSGEVMHGDALCANAVCKAMLDSKGKPL